MNEKFKMDIRRLKLLHEKSVSEDPELFDMESLVGPTMVNPSAISFVEYLTGSKKKGKKVMDVIAEEHFGRIKNRQCEPGDERFVDPNTGISSCRPKGEILAKRETFLERLLSFQDDNWRKGDKKMHLKEGEDEDEDRGFNIKSPVGKKIFNLLLRYEEAKKLQQKLGGDYELFINRLLETTTLPKNRFGAGDCPPPDDPERTQAISLANGFTLCVDPRRQSGIKNLFGSTMRFDEIDDEELAMIREIAILFSKSTRLYRENIHKLLIAARSRNVNEELKKLAFRTKDPLIKSINKRVELNPMYAKYILPGSELGLEQYFPDYFPKHRTLKNKMRFYFGNSANDGQEKVLAGLKIDGKGMNSVEKGKTPIRMSGGRYEI